jgi:hypothetical protein
MRRLLARAEAEGDDRRATLASRYLRAIKR